jgi:hypothetical protein
MLATSSILCREFATPNSMLVASKQAFHILFYSFIAVYQQYVPGNCSIHYAARKSGWFVGACYIKVLLTMVTIEGSF